MMLGLKTIKVALAIVCCCCFHQIESQSSWTISQKLDPEGRYNFTRRVDMDAKSIEIEVNVETTGFVGFGLSYNGNMLGADIVIGGVNVDRSTYFTDRHGIGKQEPVIDESQDWHMIWADENEGVTTLRFNRSFNSCDEDDIAITEDTLKIIWAFGSTDKIEFHGPNKGVVSANLLDPPQPSPDLSGLMEWPVIVNDPMPNRDTAYWCTIHTTPPQIDQKTYLVGFEAELSSKEAVTHTHHFIFSKCVTNTPEARNILEANVDKPGWDCNSGKPDSPRQFCNMYMFVWAKGGERTNFPENIGFPIMKTGEKEYYMLEIHYDNPSVIRDLTFNTGLKIYYDNKREIEAGLLVIGHEVNFLHTIPPNSENFMTVGHCPSACTEWAFPKCGINVFNVLLHSHLSGRRLKVRHIRGKEELPWLGVDDNYDFNYQQNRPLRKELVVQPGDHLIYECVTDTTWKEGNLTIGDLSTSDEMNPDYYNNPIITAPESMEDMTYNDALEKVVEWTVERRSEFQEAVKFSDQIYVCGKGGGLPEDIIYDYFKYPEIEKEYQPLNPCATESTTENGGPNNGVRSPNSPNPLSFGSILITFNIVITVLMGLQ